MGYQVQREQRGQPGAKGDKGDKGDNAYLNFTGLYSSATAYTKYDVVIYNGNSFALIVDGPLLNTQPTSADGDSNWALIGVKGKDRN